MYVLLITRMLRGVGRWACKPVNHTSWVVLVTPTDLPKSVRNRYVIEIFVALFVLPLYPFDISVGVGSFVTGLGQISSFLSLKLVCTNLSYRVLGTSTATISLSNDHSLWAHITSDGCHAWLKFVWDQSTFQERVESHKLQNEQFFLPVGL